MFPLLELEPDEYRRTGLTLQTIAAFRTGVIGQRLVDTPYADVVSYAIRRCEFDEFLLRRSGVRVLEGMAVETLQRSRDIWVVNERMKAEG